MVLSRKRKCPEDSLDTSRVAHRTNDAFYGLWIANQLAVNPLEPRDELSEQDIYERMEIDHCVRRLPRMSEQLAAKDCERNNLVTAIIGNRVLLSTKAYLVSDDEKSQISERENVRKIADELNQLYKTATERDNTRQGDVDCLDDIRTNLNYVGQAELLEAAAGIAAYWKERMNRYPDKTLFVLLGEIRKMDVDYGAPAGKVKSDEFLMDLVIQNFTDEELAHYSDRLIISESDLEGRSAEQVDVILLDDWIMTGSEMTEQRREFLTRHPYLASRMELQLVVADEEYLKIGFLPREVMYTGPWLPTRAYYMANKGESSWGIYLAGSHSSDYTTLKDLMSLVDKVEFKNGLPTGLQVVRPYHNDGYKATFRERMARVCTSHYV